MNEAHRETAMEDIACTVCGCVCDDLQLTVRDNRVTQLQPGCPLAERWLIGQDAGDQHPFARIGGQPASLTKAITEAERILRAAKSPLIYGLSRSSTRGQQASVRLADQLGASIDTTASTCHAPSIMALQNVGESTCSLGEIRHRSDLVIYWGSNPLISHPRHMERYVDASGMWRPRGREDRTVIVVDVKRTESAEAADLFIQVEPSGDFDLLWLLRSLTKGADCNVRSEDSIGGVAYPVIQDLADRLMSCQYGAVFFGLGLTKHGVPHANVEALLRLVTDLNAHTRFVARRMRVPGDVAGADTVLCWQTGFPFSVNLARGYPRYSPGEYTANSLLERQEVDAVLLVGSEGVEHLSEVAQAQLARRPLIALDYPHMQCPVPTDVQFTTAVYGIHQPGTAYRMDEVPIPLRQVLRSPLPADHEILNQILQRFQLTP